jgi:predicted permease
MIFDLLLNTVFPLYGLIALGFITGHTLKLDVEPLAILMLYVVVPIVMFGATATMDFTPQFIVPPLIIASISIVASVSAYTVAGLVWGKEDKRQNLLGFLGTGANATYFGVPIAVAIAGPEWLDVYMLMVLPLFLMDCTLSYYFALRGDFSMKDSLHRVARLPIIYGAIGGMAVNAVGFEMPDILMEYWDRFTGTMIILGMMMIGAALARMERFRFDINFFAGLCVMRYLLWPALGLAWVVFDITVMHMLAPEIHTFIILIASCPLAANTVAYASKLNLHPALTACMVLTTTILALAFIPLAMWVKDMVIAGL